MTIKMLICDIDGTLLNSKGELTPGVIAAVQEAHQKGLIVTLATGRHLRGVVPIVEKLGVNVPVILSNGAIIVDPMKQETMLHHTIDLETTHAILDVIKKHDLWSSLFFHEFAGIDTFYDRDPGFPEAYYFVQQDPTITKLVPDLKEITHANPLKVLLLEKTEKVLPLVEDLRKLDYKFNMVVSGHDFPGYTFLELNPYGITKASGIVHLAKLLGLDQSEIAAVGDNVNDIEMIEHAGLGVAMGNAAQELKAKAALLTKSNDEDGVAYLIREHLLSK